MAGLLEIGRRCETLSPAAEDLLLVWAAASSDEDLGRAAKLAAHVDASAEGGLSPHPFDGAPEQALRDTLACVRASFEPLQEPLSQLFGLTDAGKELLWLDRLFTAVETLPADRGGALRPLLDAALAQAGMKANDTATLRRVARGVAITARRWTGRFLARMLELLAAFPPCALAREQLDELAWRLAATTAAEGHVERNSHSRALGGVTIVRSCASLMREDARADAAAVVSACLAEILEPLGAARARGDRVEFFTHRLREPPIDEKATRRSPPTLRLVRHGDAITARAGDEHAYGDLRVLLRAFDADAEGGELCLRILPDRLVRQPPVLRAAIGRTLERADAPPELHVQVRKLAPPVRITTGATLIEADRAEDLTEFLSAPDVPAAGQSAPSHHTAIIPPAPTSGS